MTEPLKPEKCDGSRDPRRRCGLHHGTGLAWICGGLECCCGDSWLDVRNICSTGAEPGAPVSLKDRLDSLISWANTADERMAVADVVFAALDEQAKQTRAKVAEEILAERASLPIITIIGGGALQSANRAYRDALYAAANLALTGTTRTPQPAPDAEPLIDPDCRGGKCSSCVGGPCEHECHQEQRDA